MKHVIIICLLMILILLLQDKMIFKKSKKEMYSIKKSNINQPDIIGKTKPIRKYQELKKVIDKTSQETPDLHQEQQDFEHNFIPKEDSIFTRTITFEELNTAHSLLQKNNLESSEKQIALALIEKIQDTELFSLLESNIENASQKIAALLDLTIFSESTLDSNNKQKNEIEDFDIREYL